MSNSSLSVSFKNNLAGSCEVGFLFNSVSSLDCAGAQGVNVYSSKIGVAANPKATSVIYDMFFLIDNARGVGLKFGGTTQSPNNLFLKNSWISIAERASCDYCYGPNTTSCSSTTALRLLTVS